MRSDTRRFDRIEIEVPARIEIIESRKKRKPIESYVSNLSASGAFFPALKSIPLGKQVKVDIFLLFEGQHPVNEEHDMVVLSVTAVVIRSDHAGTAVAFAEDYRMTSSRICDDLLVTREVETGPTAYESVTLMINQYSHANG